MDDAINRTLEGLKARCQGSAARDHEEACCLILDLVPRDMTVGVGYSSTVRQLEVERAFWSRETEVINHFDPEKKIDSERAFFELVFRPFVGVSVCDFFPTGTNAVTEDGKLFNIDRADNRVAGMFWGYSFSIIVAGENKIVKDLNEAFERVKNIVAMEHLRRRGPPRPVRSQGRAMIIPGRKGYVPSRPS